MKSGKIIKSLKEYKETYFPEKAKKESFSSNNPKKLGILLAEKVIDKNKHILYAK